MAAPIAAPGPSTFTVALPDEHATRRLMVDIANALQPGDLITLSGDLGAGKTMFARALIRHLAGDPSIEVPSPTFTLMQTYDLPQFPVVHADFYRLSGAAELAELGFDDLPDDAVILVEWAERAGSPLRPDRLDITLTLAPKLKPEFRHARVTGYGTFSPRVDRIARVRQFIAEGGYGNALRQRIQGDASTRSYERFVHGDKRAILMNSPQRPDGPPIRDGKPYSAIAHLAESVVPFVAIANGLRDRGFSAPAILHADLAQGLLFIEDLGEERVCAGEPPVPIAAHYEAAVDVLVALHGQQLPDTLAVSPHVDYRIPPYDADAFLIEADLMLDWFLPRFGLELAARERDQYRELWREHLQPAIASPPTWVLRDFHSPNLLWLPRRTGIARIGILDFQDALMGPAAYDLASLLQDARIDVPEQSEVALLGRYVLARRQQTPGFDHTEFIKTYVTLAAQRSSKILGIFARLDMRDGKPQYLRHLPRIWGYLHRSLSHPSLKGLRAWYGANVPSLKTI